MSLISRARAIMHLYRNSGGMACLPGLPVGESAASWELSSNTVAGNCLVLRKPRGIGPLLDLISAEFSRNFTAFPGLHRTVRACLTRCGIGLYNDAGFNRRESC